MAKRANMLSDALISLVKPPATHQYPYVRKDAPERFRGMLTWDIDACIGCGICQKVCPAEALEMIVLDRKEKRFVMRYYIDRCTYCAQCQVSCPKQCIDLSDEDWENAALDRDGFTHIWGSDENIKEVLQKENENSDSAT